MFIMIVALAGLSLIGALIYGYDVEYNLTSLSLVFSESTQTLGFQIEEIYVPLLDMNVPFCLMYLDINGTQSMTTQMDIIGTEDSTNSYGLQSDTSSGSSVNSQSMNNEELNLFINGIASMFSLVAGGLGIMSILGIILTKSGPWGTVLGIVGLIITIVSFCLLMIGIVKMVSVAFGYGFLPRVWILGAMFALVLSVIIIPIGVIGGIIGAFCMVHEILLTGLGIMNVILSILEFYVLINVALMINQVQVFITFTAVMIAAGLLKQESGVYIAIIMMAIILFGSILLGGLSIIAPEI